MQQNLKFSKEANEAIIKEKSDKKKKQLTLKERFDA